MEVYKDLFKNRFVENYKRWIFHGEERACIREEEVRARLEEYDGDVGMADMVVDYNEAHGNEGLVEEDPEETAKAFYEMMSSAQKPLHEKTTMSQLDAIGRLLALKS
jgi:glycerol kinase